MPTKRTLDIRAANAHMIAKRTGTTSKGRTWTASPRREPDGTESAVVRVDGKVIPDPRAAYSKFTATPLSTAVGEDGKRQRYEDFTAYYEEEFVGRLYA